ATTAVGISLHNAGVDSKAFTSHQTLCHAAPNDTLKYVPEYVTLPESAMSILREAGVVGHLVLEPEPAEPAIGQVQMHFLAQTSLRTDPEAVAHQQHSHHQLGINGWSARMAIRRREMLAQIRQVEKPVNAPEQMLRGHMLIEVEGIKESVLVAAALSHHAGALPIARPIN